MTTRIINGVKFEYEVAERSLKELLEIAAQDESLDMEDFEAPDVKIAVGDVFDEFLGFEVYDLKDANDAVIDYLEKITEHTDEKDEMNVMYVIGDAEDKIYSSFEAPDVLKSLETNENLMKERAERMKALEGKEYIMPIKEYDDGERVIAFNGLNDGYDNLELDIHNAIDEVDETNGDINICLDAYYKPENMTEVTVEDALNYYLDLIITMEDAPDDQFDVEIECEEIEGDENNLIARIINVDWC